MKIPTATAEVKSPNPTTVPEPGLRNDAVTTANINRTTAQEMTTTRELGLPPTQVAQPQPTTPVTPVPSIVTTLLEKKRDYESMRQQAIDELLNVIGNARQQLAELGWEDETVPAFRVPTYRRPGRPTGTTIRPVGRPRTAHAPEQRHIAVGMKNKVCPVCGEKGHDARSHRAENLKAIAAGKRKAKR